MNLCKLLLSLETPNDVRSVALSPRICKGQAKALTRLHVYTG